MERMPAQETTTIVHRATLSKACGPKGSNVFVTKTEVEWIIPEVPTDFILTFS